MGLLIVGLRRLPWRYVEPRTISTITSAMAAARSAALPFWVAGRGLSAGSDFMLYWIHRIFHGAHALALSTPIHHSAEEVDWTTAYRFHPVNLWLGTFLVDVSCSMLGVSPAVLLFLVPFQTTIALFVHANLNWTLGPLKYVVATPVFHRWHHTRPDEGGNSNFASMFALWDVLFGTFYMPPRALPDATASTIREFPARLIEQSIYPFRDGGEPPRRERMRRQPAMRPDLLDRGRKS